MSSLHSEIKISTIGGAPGRDVASTKRKWKLTLKENRQDKTLGCVNAADDFPFHPQQKEQERGAHQESVLQKKMHFHRESSLELAAMC